MAKFEQHDPELVGYARVSTEEQSLDLQIEALKRAGVHPDAIYMEKVSGVAKRRPQRALAVKHCRPGSTFVCWKLDRVGRSLLDLLKFLEMLETKGIKFKSLQDNIDTSTPAGRFFVSILGAVAQFERDLISQRTKAGVQRAQERGVRFGRAPKIDAKKDAEIEKLIAEGWTITELADKFGVSKTTIRNHFPMDRLDKIRRKR